jgi:hypothetical protein
MEFDVAYDDLLADRMRSALEAESGISERKMFGGLAFMAGGHMFVGVLGNVLMARVGPERYIQELSRAHVRVMDFTGKPMKGYVFVDPPGFDSDSDLSYWIRACIGFVRTLPAKAQT